MNAWLHRARAAALDVVGVAAGIVFALPSIGYPFGIDQPIHYYIGRQLLRAEMPYAESALSTKPPGAFVVHALSLLLFGDHQWSIRILDLAFVLASGVLVATFRARRLDPAGRVLEVPPRRGGEIGAACLVVAVLYYGLFDFSDTAHPELWQATFMLAACWAVVRAPDGRVSLRRAFAAGVLACCAVTFKHVAALTGVVCGFAVVWLWLSHRDWRMALKAAGTFTAGVALVLFVTMAPFWLTGTFDGFWEIMVEYIIEYAGKAGAHGSAGWPRWLTMRYALPPVAVCVAALWMGHAVAASGGDRRQRRVGWWIVASLAAAIGSVLIQRRILFWYGWTYHLIVLVPFLALALTWGLRQRFRGRGWPQLVAAVLLAGVVLAESPRWTHQPEWGYREEWGNWWGYVNGERDATEYHAIHNNGVLENHARLEHLAQILNARRRPGDTLCLDGFIAHLYQLTGMRCTGRFIIGDGVNEVPSWRTEYAEILRERPPTFFVTFRNRPRVRQLRAMGYTSQEVRLGPAEFVILERREE